MITIALVDPDPQFEKEIEILLEGRADMVIVASARSLNHALAVAEEYSPNVMIMGPGNGPDISVSFAKKLTSRYAIGCLLLTLNLPAYHKQSAMRANIVDVIQVPVDPDKLVSAIHMAAGFAQQLSQHEQVAQEPKKCAVITVFSTKGGVGKTVLATNIAASIAKASDSRVVLIDLDLQFGDVGIAMGLPPEKSILDFAGKAFEGAMQLDGLFSPHESGVKVLLAPKEPESADLITGECVSSIISMLKDYADFIVIDTPASFNDNVLAVLDQTDEICLVLTLDMPSLKNIKLCLRTLHELQYASDKFKLVVNRVESNVGLGVREVEKALGMRALAAIATDKAIPLSVNKGIPVVIDNPKTQVSKDISDLALFYINKHRPDLVDIAMIV